MTWHVLKFVGRANGSSETVGAANGLVKIRRMETAPARLRGKASWLIGRITLYAHRRIADALASQGAHGHHFAILAALAEFGPASQITIGQRCLIDRSDMAEMVTELVDQGLVVRATDPGDRRRNVISLTTAGRRRFERLDAVLEEAQRDLFAPLAPAEYEQLVNLLGRVFDQQISTAGPARSGR
ncbi:MAG TPA: MarR family transcriptional regulator [Asanoa sp.]|nr:MarR family transcriptional regulator [Asanoa sp.]